ncbi:competence protein CoiA family protein [Kitasatospora sp. NPDC002965]|uniref:competence protein CoiA family protein n=1 Tax=Kitasatospora sp. NPDC002965 TaxID=3154775 RepID=UPI0033B099DB
MDRRLIQTAVVGSADSDEPVICPEDPQELDAFRKENTGATWWCGVNLPGGCGRQLMTRRCADKICHFAHYPSAGDEHGLQCGRQARGKDSADHLFMKAELAAWLKSQNIAVTFDFPEPRGSAIVSDLADGRRLLVHLDRTQPVNWDDAQVTEFLLGTGVLIPPDRLAARGYVHRIRYESERDGRRPLIIGTQMPGQTDWSDLRTLVLTSQGFAQADRAETSLTEQTATHVPGPSEHTGKGRSVVAVTRSDTAAASTSRTHEAAQAAIRELKWAGPAQLRETMATVEALIAQDQSVEDRRHLSEALANGQRRLTEQTNLCIEVMIRLRGHVPGTLSGQLLEEAQRLTSDPGASDEDRALVAELSERYRAEAEQRLVAERQQRILADREQQAALQQQRAALRERQKQARAALEDVQRRRKGAQRREKSVAPPVPRQREEQWSVAEYAELAKPLLGALKKAAREGETRTWDSIADRTGTKRLRQLGHPAKVEVLILAESGTAADRPLWSVLLAAGGSQEDLALHRAVCERLGRPLPAGDEALRTRLDEDRAVLRHSW